MKTMALLTIVAAMETGVHADELTVYLQGSSVVPATMLGRARGLANEMFSGRSSDMLEGIRTRSHCAVPNRLGLRAFLILS